MEINKSNEFVVGNSSETEPEDNDMVCYEFSNYRRVTMSIAIQFGIVVYEDTCNVPDN